MYLRKGMARSLKSVSLCTSHIVFLLSYQLVVIKATLALMAYVALFFRAFDSKVLFRSDHKGTPLILIFCL